MASLRASIKEISRTVSHSLTGPKPPSLQHGRGQNLTRAFSSTSLHQAQLPDRKAPGLKPKPATSPPPASPSPPKSKPPNSSLPIAAANRFIVDGLTARSGPGTGADSSRKGQPLRPGEELPAKYRPAARRITAIMLGLPVVFVLGYVLFQRQFLGVEKKRLVRVEDVDGVEGVKRT